MSRVRGKNTSPEIRVRKAAHALGFRFRLHREDLPGKPDLIFPKRNLALFVHGCFWHRHTGCPKASAPSSDYWAEKFATNVARDTRVATELRRQGWRVEVIWECQTKDEERLVKTLTKKIVPKKRKKKTHISLKASKEHRS
jgi:DNA mismatch endonuclease (patch repair protein)